MKVSTEELDNCEVLMTVELETKQRDKILQKAARRISKEVQIPGFRPGKAPYKVVVSRFGEAAVQDEAAEELTTTIFRKAIEQAEIEPVAPSAMTDVQWEPEFILKIKVPVEPVVELGNYRETDLTYETPEVSDEEIQAELTRLQEEMSIQEPTNSPAELGDTLNISVEVVNGEGDLVDEDDYEIVLAELEEDDSDEVDFATHLLGLSEGDTQEFTHTVSLENEEGEEDEDAEESYEYTVTINAITRQVLDPLDDDFASLVGDFDTLDALKEDIRATILKDKLEEAESELVDTYLQEIIDQAETLKWPEALEKIQLENAVHNYRHRIEDLGISWDMFLQIQNKSVDQIVDELRESVVEDMQKSLTVDKLSVSENLTVDEEEFEAEFARLVASAGNTEEAVKAYSSPGGIDFIVTQLITNKVRERLLAILKGEAPSLEEIEAQKAEEAKEAEEVEEVEEAEEEEAAESTEETTLEAETATEARSEN